MDFNNTGDIYLYVQNLERQARQAQEAQERERRQAQEAQERERRQAQEVQERERRQAQERERLLLRQIEERDQQLEERDQQLRLRQRTLIREYVRLCQSIFYDEMHVERDALLRTKGSLTKVKGKYHPRKLEEMCGFKEELQKIFDEACALFSPEHRVFDSADEMRTTMEGRIRPIGHESTLSIFLLDFIEIPVKKILKRLKAVDEDEIFFETDVQILFELEPQEISSHMGGPSEESPQPDIEIEPAEVPPAMPRLYYMSANTKYLFFSNLTR
ncbi:hypothetical protein E4U44_004291 [Claviceps purpurea]|nr:hypothetical protein E4U44_004291 [Claviceps purpurea]